MDATDKNIGTLQITSERLVNEDDKYTLQSRQKQEMDRRFKQNRRGFPQGARVSGSNELRKSLQGTPHAFSVVFMFQKSISSSITSLLLMDGVLIK